MALGLRCNGSISKSNRRDQLQARYGQEDAPSVQQRSAKLKGSYRSIRSFAISRANGEVAPIPAVLVRSSSRRVRSEAALPLPGFAAIGGAPASQGGFTASDRCGRLRDVLGRQV
jgi:hypothetical protein